MGFITTLFIIKLLLSKYLSSINNFSNRPNKTIFILMSNNLLQVHHLELSWIEI